MENEQQKLISKNGPVFDSDPGWGAKVKAWLGKYFYKVILPILVIILVGYGIASRQSPTDNNELLTVSPTPENTGAVSVTVVKGDGRMLVARRALVDYLVSNPQDLTSAQKMYVETVLGSALQGPLTVSSAIDFQLDDIRTAIASSNDLTDSQIQKWNSYAQKAGIK